MELEGFLFAITFFCGLLATMEGKHRGKGCPLGCSTCSVYNGCITCKPRYLFLLHRSGMKQVGICTHACPVGFYPNSAGDYHRCSRCRIENCDTCYSRTFCSRCQPPYVGLYGKCVLQCPDSMYVNEMTSQCEVKVDCAVSPWSPWSPCIKKGQTCGFKWGEHRRYREVVARPTPEAEPCPELFQGEKCRMHPRYCPGQLPRKPKDKGKRKKEKGTTDNQEGTTRKNDGNKQKDRTNRRSKKKDRQKPSPRDERRQRQRKEEHLIDFPLSTRRTI
eukprot:XP_796266.3 PREDICTED: R-spondin-2 isoform X1 [Strongylocentrotus purpuratus]